MGGAITVFPPTRELMGGALAEFNLQELAETPVWKLSFGQKKALSFCVLSLVKRDIWILDEPFAGLDNDLTDKVKKLFCEFNDGGGIIIATSHTVKGFDGFNTTIKELL
jgi:heme exporter protein A